MKQTTKSDLTRQRILDAGRKLVLTQGFSGVGLSGILAESQVPKGSFYYYFSSKEQFGTELLADYVKNYLEHIDALFSGTEPASVRLDKFWDAWIASTDHVGIASECLVVKLGAEVADLSEAMRETLNKGIDDLVARIAHLLRQGARDGSIRALDDPGAVARMLYARWLGAAILAKLDRSDTPLRLARAETSAQLAPIGTNS